MLELSIPMGNAENLGSRRSYFGMHKRNNGKTLWQVLTDRVVYRWVRRDPMLETSNLLRDKQRLTSSGMSILNVEEIGHSLTKWDLDKVLAL